jgi:hypothetical protein
MKKSYVTYHDLEGIAGARSYEDLTTVALRVLARMPQPVAMIHGPLTTGGTSLEENWIRIRTRIFSSREKDHAVFNQMPFLKVARRIARRKASPVQRVLSFFLFWRKKKESAIDRHEFREKFHLPIVRSGYIQEMYFMAGWEDSTGARWYHDQAEKLGIKIMYLPPSVEDAQETQHSSARRI